ncbi:XRE family transcriptional regulator [Streptomyces armeniacus]|uniref:XRE family transcriptional regulator n=1 Tax=Streptomyces armeniacus TaxID=83291 RepID=A0A345XL96_9ACTN|nr:helix-turn-helix transcriptional regulator [Streptomyces armeniacus]AXK32412.1 XRE family transcriptional regulator [Streptomyces armeniacus]
MPDQPPRFGPELRRLRLAAGLSLTRLGQLVHYSKGQLSKVERGLKPPGLQLARLCDAALSADGRLAGLVPEQSPEAELPETSDDGEVWLMQLSTDGSSWFQPVSRRQVVAVGAASAVALGIGAAAASASASADSVSASAAADGTTLLDGARSLFDQYRRLGQTASPEIVLPALIAQTHTLRELSARTGARTRRGLLTLASRYAEYVGWLTQETGNDQAALWWTDRAVELAAAGGDHDLAAYALVRRALVTFYRGDATQTVELAERAQAAEPPPRIWGLAAQQEAQGHALAGRYDACMRGLDRARVSLAASGPDPDSPVIGTTHLSDPVSMITGWCLHDLGRPREAAEVLDREIAQIPGHALRTHVRYGVRRALAHATAGEIDHACELVRPLFAASEAVTSATTNVDTRRLARTLNRFPDHPAVRELSPYLTAALHGAAT